ncbi:hypothetical protein MHU86_8777 [Fragilaria crotonensis]|nr:hypothetical protein MHU86_8777 [Fragilaria crotonensis]
MKVALFLPLLLGTGCAFSPLQQKVRPETHLKTSSRREWVQTALVGIVAFPAAQQASAAPREVWLTEPTEEFKANEAKAMDFKRSQLAIKADFNKVLERFTTDSKTEEQLVADLADLRLLVKKTGGLPLGVKKDELVKIIRRKKASGFGLSQWNMPTSPLLLRLHVHYATEGALLP